MLGFRMALGATCAALALGAAAGCGGSVEHGGPSAEAGTGQGGAVGKAGASSGGSTSPGRGGSGAATAGGSQAGSAIVDPDPVDAGCPEQDPLPPDLQCDPFTSGSCGAGLGCYPFVEHPDGNGCEPQHYGTVCAPAGSRIQGESCGDDTSHCAPGFVCVVGQRAGKRCSALCQLGKANGCSGGLLCSDLDVAGFGVCG
jgi:hypothetical protein